MLHNPNCGNCKLFSHGLASVAVKRLYLKELRQEVIKQDTLICINHLQLTHIHQHTHTHKEHTHTQHKHGENFMYEQYFSIDNSFFTNYKLQDNQSDNNEINIFVGN